MSTTLLNAYLEPVLVHYIGDLSEGLDRGGVETRQRFLMQSNGGVMPFSAAVAGAKTVHTLFSGPAAGAQAASKAIAGVSHSLEKTTKGEHDDDDRRRGDGEERRRDKARRHRRRWDKS